MPKKTTRTAKSSQQKAREEQWRRRVTAQGLATIDDVAEVSPADDLDDTMAEEAVPVASTRTMTAARPRQASQVGSGRAASAAQQRRTPAAATRASRLRPAATSLSMEEEMYYVRSDIRRLIILTAICLAVLIALSFIIR